MAKDAYCPACGFPAGPGCKWCHPPIDAPAPKPDDLQQAISQLRALEAAGEDPRNAHQLYDITPEQAGALLAHLDDVEQCNAAAVALWREVEGYKDSLRATVSITWVERMEAALAPAQEASDGK